MSNDNSAMREELARRLYEARYGAVDPGWSVYDGDAAWLRDDVKLWLPVADEVIRQMEWARRHTITPGWTMDISVPEFPRKIVFNQYDELSLAPKDWTP